MTRHTFYFIGSIGFNKDKLRQVNEKVGCFFHPKMPKYLNLMLTLIMLGPKHVFMGTFKAPPPQLYVNIGGLNL